MVESGVDCSGVILKLAEQCSAIGDSKR